MNRMGGDTQGPRLLPQGRSTRSANALVWRQSLGLDHHFAEFQARLFEEPDRASGSAPFQRDEGDRLGGVAQVDVERAQPSSV
jgi:hypothetical protein